MDGIHLYSQDGAEALTFSLLAILNRAGMVRRPVQWGLSSSSSPSSGQWTAQAPRRGYRANSGHQARGHRRGQEFELPVHNSYQVFQ